MSISCRILVDAADLQTGSLLRTTIHEVTTQHGVLATFDLVVLVLLVVPVTAARSGIVGKTLAQTHHAKLAACSWELGVYLRLVNTLVIVGHGSRRNVFEAHCGSLVLRVRPDGVVISRRVRLRKVLEAGIAAMVAEGARRYLTSLT